jgi:hypothetical protein
MNNSFKNFLLLVAVLVLSCFTAPYFGALYDKFYPQNGSSFLGIGEETAVFVAGVPFAYMFLIPFVFELFGSGNKKKLILWALLPVVLFYLYDSVGLSYIPIILAIIAFALAKLVNFIISKLHHPNPPMVIK